MKKIITAALALAMCMQFAACSQNDNSSKAESTTSATTAQTTAAELVEPEEHGTSEYVDYIYYKAREDAKTATDEQLQEAVDWLKNNTKEYFSGPENMEKTMYYGQLLEHKYKKTGNQYEKIGWQAFKTVKYVYRGVEDVLDEVTYENYLELEAMSNALEDIVK